jgi:hypothetical protein
MNWELFFQLNAEYLELFAYGSIIMLGLGMVVTLIAVMKHENGKYTHYLDDVYSGMFTGE